MMDFMYYINSCITSMMYYINFSTSAIQYNHENPFVKVQWTDLGAKSRIFFYFTDFESEIVHFGLKSTYFEAKIPILDQKGGILP